MTVSLAPIATTSFLFGVGFDRLSLRVGKTKKIQWKAGLSFK
ncbi:hypothetical protein [Chryseobacterium hispalense]|nr:hypothetical protein [Chryseobacterium hispalense]